MKKFLVAILILAFSVSSVFAQPKPEIFWKTKVTGIWSVTGILPSKAWNGQCVAETTWTDGTSFMIIKDLFDDELYVQIYNPDWRLPGRSGHLTIDFDVVGKNERILSRFSVVRDEDTILIRNLQNTDFMRLVFDGRKMGIGMSDSDNPNLYLTLEGSRNMIELIVECYKYSKTELNRQSGGNRK